MSPTPFPRVVTDLQHADTPKMSTDTSRSNPLSPTLYDEPCDYTYLTGTATTDQRSSAVRLASREPSATYAPAAASANGGTGGPEAKGSRIVARILALFAPSRSDSLRELQTRLVNPPATPLALQRTVSANPHPAPPRARMSRRTSWFVTENKAHKIDASVLGNVNVPGSNRPQGPSVVIDAATLGNVNIPALAREGPKVTLTAATLAKVNVPEPRAASRTLQLSAKDLADVNVSTGESHSRRGSRAVEVQTVDVVSVNVTTGEPAASASRAA